MSRKCFSIGELRKAFPTFESRESYLPEGRHLNGVEIDLNKYRKLEDDLGPCLTVVLDNGDRIKILGSSGSNSYWFDSSKRYYSIPIGHYSIVTLARDIECESS